MKKISFKNNVWSILLGIVLLICMLPLIAVWIALICDPEIQGLEKIITAVIGGIILLFPLGGAVLAIMDYFEVKKRLRDKVAKYGEDNLIESIRNHTVCEYTKPMGGVNNKVYFTDKYIIDPSKAIIEYSEISLMYKHVFRSKYGAVSSIAFELLDGTRQYLCNYINDEQIREYMEVCHQHNLQIMFGNNKENLKKHKARKNSYKKKPVAESHASDEKQSEPKEYAPEECQSASAECNSPKNQLTPEGRKYRSGSVMFYGGFIGTLITIPVIIGSSIIIILQGNMIVNAAVTMALLFLACLPVLIFCFLFMFFGKKIMKKYAAAAGEYEESVSII